MPKYDAENFDPPAPVAHVTLRHPATGDSISNVPMLIDTGADASLVPAAFAEELGIQAEVEITYEVQGFGGESKQLPAAQLEMIFLGRKFTGQFLLVDQPIGILGRNILSAVSIVLDGPRSKWDERKR